MHELMFALAAMLPKEKILEDLKDALQDYMLFPDDKEKESNLQMNMALVTIHLRTKGSINEAMSLAKDMEDKEKKLSLFETSGN
jgi:hypothetical protein